MRRSGERIRFERAAMLDALRAAVGDDGEPFDVVVIGGGITGAGVALDAAARGLRTALVERDDFASGTSSKSSKMVHGGLRYLRNGDVRLVYEALHERRRLMANAPHLVDILPFMIPILTRDGVVSRKIARALGSAMWMYDLTGGWRIGKLHKRLSAAEAAEHFPSAHVDKLSGGYLYFDASVDDARLTLTVARTAADRGAVVVNRCAAVDITKAITGAGDERADGVTVEADGETFHVPARCVVIAAGVWADEVRALDETTPPDSIRPAKGVHITIPWELVGNDVAVIVPVRSDKRSLFIVPWGRRADGTFRHAYVGTTDTDYDGPLGAPRCTDDDISYILTALDEALTATVRRSDITGVWAGLRPLVKATDADDAPESTTDLSRRHQVAESPSGVVRIEGGKLTTYREMAEDTVEHVIDLLDRSEPGRPSGSRRKGSRRKGGRLRVGRLTGVRRRPVTRRLRLLGAQNGPPADATAVDVHLAHRYGSMADEIRVLIAFDPTLAGPLVDGQPYLRAEAVYAVRHEMATTLDDVLLRRTRAHLFDREASLAAAADVARLLGDELGWNDAEIERQLDNYRRLCADEEAAGTSDAHVANSAD